MFPKSILFPSSLFLTCVIFLSMSTLPLTQGQSPNQKQFLRFYSQRSCNVLNLMGQVENTTLLQQNSPYRNASSVAVNGFWRVDYTNTSSQVLQSDGNCVNLNSTNGIYIVTRYGNEYQNSSDIFIYISPLFAGVPYQIGRNGMNFTGSFTIGSWYFTGNNEWTLYTGTRYNGTSSCLRPDANIASRGYGFRFNLYDSKAVGSVKYGCYNGSGSSSIFQNFSMILILLPLFNFIKIN